MLLVALVGPNNHSGNAWAQDAAATKSPSLVDDVSEEIETPEKVEVEPVADDSDISSRLERIYGATGWFDSINVETDEGVVFLNGVADSDSHRDWAERVAQRTSDVVAVVNQISVKAPSVWDIRPAIGQLQQLGRDFIQLVPLLAIGAVILLLAYLIAKLAASTARRVTSRRIDSQLLQQVVASIAGVLVMLIGLYIALKVSGLSRLAVTVLGGTGLVGLALGFAFRDIAENYLASVLISLNRPFRVGDLIELDGNQGFVRRVTTRGTLLLTLDGNHIQIPNSTVYKSVITNFSSSPKIRKSFTLGIGYEDSVTEAQEIVHRVLREHDSVLGDPEPLVLVQSLGAATVNLQVLYWLDGERFDALSVTSALMRQTKAALADANISMPDEAREVVFPQGVPVAMPDTEVLESLPQSKTDANGKLPDDRRTQARSQFDHPRDNVESTNAEGNLQNTDQKIQQHAESAEVDQGENLIS